MRRQRCKEIFGWRVQVQKTPFSYSEYLDTLAKLTPQKGNAKFHYALFSESGFDEKIIAEAEKDNTLLYPLAYIVNYK